MYRDPAANWDGQALAADHSKTLADAKRLGTMTKADRLLHGICNKERGDGSRDQLRPAITGTPPGKTPVTEDVLGFRAMDWP